MYRKYNVVVEKGNNIQQLEDALLSSSGTSTIPTRQVEIANACPMSKRVTSFFLTDAEAISLREHEQVSSVTLDISDDPDAKMLPTATQGGDFRRTGMIEDDYSDYTNWGLYRHNTRDKDSHLTASDSDASVDYSLAGEGVDVIIMDTGIQADHPDFTDEYGNCRIQKINWYDVYEELYPNSNKYTPIYKTAHDAFYYYQDQVGPHGTQTASIACGKKYGYAKKAHIYLAKVNLGNIFFQLDLTDWYNMIIHWHKNKGNSRPTVVNMSFGKAVFGINYDEIDGGAFRDSADESLQGWTRSTQTDAEIADAYNIKIGTEYYSSDAQHKRTDSDPAQDALVQDMIDAGIHVVISAGNFSERLVKPTHPEYGNYVNFTAQQEVVGGSTEVQGTWFYNRPGSWRISRYNRARHRK